MTILFILAAVSAVFMFRASYRGGRKGLITNNDNSHSIKPFMRQLELWVFGAVNTLISLAIVFELRDDKDTSSYADLIGISGILFIGLMSYFCYLIGRNIRVSKHRGRYRHKETQSM